MGANVFANGREISAKKSGDKTIAKMPDVCLSPPSPPAGPIPIPYPNFANSKDTTGGTKKVKIAGAEVGLKGKSSYKKCKGDTAATRSFGASVLSHNLEGPIKHVAGSFDVTFEGTNVVRFGDLTTGNHTNPTTGSVGPIVGGVGVGVADAECTALSNKNEEARKDLGAKTKDKTLVGPNGKGRGTTVSSMKSTPKAGGRSKIMSAHNNHKATAKCPKGLAKGGGKAVRSGKKSTLCGNYTHPAPASQKSGHAEARLFDELGAAKPRNITLNIDWRPRTGKPSKMPCQTCQNMLCKARECGHDISLCDSKGQKQKLSEEHCQASPGTYEKLQKTMGEYP
ncbi:MAG: PAAR-like domain-containing protein [Nitrospirales bacterium]